jgi:hypothetical protein
VLQPAALRRAPEYHKENLKYRVTQKKRELLKNPTKIEEI